MCAWRGRGGGVYLAAEGDLDGDGHHLGQQTAVERHHEGHGVVVGENKRHLVALRGGEELQPEVSLEEAGG